MQLGACQVLAAVLWLPQNENPARVCDVGAPRVGSREPSFGWENQELCYEGSASQTYGRPKVPHGTSCSLMTRHHAQAAAVLDHSRALPQCDGGARPSFARGAVCGERNLVILDAGDVLDDACPVSGPGIDAEGEASSRCAHVRLFYPNPSRP